MRAGHEVHLLCQDREPLALPGSTRRATGTAARCASRSGASRCARRSIAPTSAGCCPSTSPTATRASRRARSRTSPRTEVEAYVARNVAAVREVAARARPDVALANHLVMGPLVLARALGGRVPYAVKIHGSALEYTVKPHPRFMPAAREGSPAPAACSSARGTPRRACGPRWPSPALRGADAARPAGRRRRALRAAHARGGAPAGAGGLRRAARARMAPAARERLRRFARDPRRGGRRARRALDPARDRIVVFVGKLIASKGVELLLAAFPLVLARVPDARLLVVGFGAFRAGSRSSRPRSRAATSRPPARCAARTGGSCLSWPRSSTPSTAALRRAARGMAGRVHWAGRLEHGELTDVLPAAEALVMPSTFPEAFGMVAAEAAACGALPVVAGHSGMAEVARALAEAVDPRGAPVADVPGRPGGGRGARRPPRGWLEAPEECARRRARRSSAWRASASRGTASRAP